MPKKKTASTASGLSARQYIEEKWQTYEATWIKLQLQPQYQQSFFEQIVYPHRQKTQHKLSLKRNTEAGIKTLTKDLIRAYGRRVWGAKSQWLIGGPRDGSIVKVSHLAASTEWKASTQNEHRKTEDMNVLVKEGTTSPMEYDSDATIDEQDAETHSYVTAATGSEMDTEEAPRLLDAGSAFRTVSSHADAYINPGLPRDEDTKGGDKADLYIEIPEDKERIELILNSLWRQMRDVLFEDRTAQSINPQSCEAQKKPLQAESNCQTKMAGGHGRSRRTVRYKRNKARDPAADDSLASETPVDSQSASKGKQKADQDESDTHSEAGSESALSGVSAPHQGRESSEVPPALPNIMLQGPCSHENEAMQSLRALVGRLTKVAWKQAVQDPESPFVSAPDLPNLRALIGAIEIDAIEEPVSQAGSIYSTIEEACKHANDSYRGNPVFNPFKWLIENGSLRSRYMAELHRRNINPNSGEPYTWSEIAKLVCPKEAELLYQYRILRRHYPFLNCPCDKHGLVTDPASCAMATAEAIADGRIPDGSRLVAFSFDQYGNISFSKKNVMVAGMHIPDDDLNWYRLTLERVGYKFTSSNIVIAPPGPDLTVPCADHSIGPLAQNVDWPPIDEEQITRDAVKPTSSNAVEDASARVSPQVGISQDIQTEDTVPSDHEATEDILERGRFTTPSGNESQYTEDEPVPNLPETGLLRPYPSPLTGSRYYFNEGETAEMIRRLRLLTHIVSTESEPGIFQSLFESDIDRQQFVERGYLIFKDAYTEPPRFVPDWMTNPATDIDSPSNEPWAHYNPHRVMPTCFPLSPPAPFPSTMQIALTQSSPPLPISRDPSNPINSISQGIRYFETSWLGPTHVSDMMRFYEDICTHCTLPSSGIESFVFSYGWSEKMVHIRTEAQKEWPFDFAAMPIDWKSWDRFREDLREGARQGVKVWRLKVLVVGREE